MGTTNYDIWESVKKNVYEKTLKEIKQVIETCNGNVAEVLKYSLNAVCDVTHSVAGTFWYYDVNDTKCIVAKAVRGGADLSAIRLKPGEGIAGKVIQTGEGHKAFDVKSDSSWSSRTDEETKFVTKTMICVPMTINDYTFGCIQLVNKTDDSFFDEDDYKIATDLAECICGVIDEYKIFTEIRESEDAAVFFIRINNYDEISRHLTPKKNIELLNMYYKDIANAIVSHNGVVDFCYYDQIVGYWVDHGNDSKTIGHDTYKAVIDILDKASELNKLAYGHFKCDVDISMGISFGPVYKQEIGYGDKVVRTIVGPAVTNSKYIQSFAKEGDAYVDRDYADITGNECRIGKTKTNTGGGLFNKQAVKMEIFEILL